MIHEYLQPLINALHTHPHWGLFVAFMTAFLESLAVIGTIVPGSITMTAIGALVGAAVLPAGTTIFWAVMGAYAGDCLSYWFGLRYGESLRKIWPFTRYPNLIPKGEKFFQEHGKKSIVIGRFTGPVRSLVPMIAGILKMPPMSFLPIAFVSAMLWALLYMAPGMLLGALSLQLPPKVATQFILIGLLLIVVLWGIFWLVKFFFDQLWNQIDRGLIRWWNYLNVHKNSHWITQLLRNPQHEEDHQQLVRAVFALLFGFLFLVVMGSVMTHNFLTYFNFPLYSLLQSFHIPSLDNFMVTMTLLGDKRLLLCIALILFLWLCWQRRWWSAGHLLLISAACTIAVGVLKPLTHSARPPVVALLDHTSSFPSGHTVMSIGILGFIAVLIAENAPAKRFWIMTTVICTVFLIALSRLYLGDHWLTDVVGSVFLSMSLLLFTTLSYRRRSVLPIAASNLTLVVLVTIFVIWVGAGYVSFRDFQQNATKHFQTETISASDLNTLSTNIPLYRTNRTGNPAEPLNIRWLAPLPLIQQYLLAQGWQMQSAKFSISGVISLFSSTEKQRHLPIIPALYHNRSPILLLIKNQGADQPLLILRLWQSDVVVQGHPQPLWLGTVQYYTPPKRLLTIQTKKHTEKTFNATAALLPYLNIFQVTQITIPDAQKPHKLQYLQWDGQLLLIQPRDFAQ